MASNLFISNKHHLSQNQAHLKLQIDGATALNFYERSRNENNDLSTFYRLFSLLEFIWLSALIGLYLIEI